MRIANRANPANLANLANLGTRSENMAQCTFFTIPRGGNRGGYLELVPGANLYTGEGEGTGLAVYRG